MQNIGHIILISVTPSTSYAHDVRETRKICNELAGKEIQNPTASGELIHTHILTEYPKLAYDDVQVYSLGDFMELNNNEEYRPDEWFMSYVYSI